MAMLKESMKDSIIEVDALANIVFANSNKPDHLILDVRDAEKFEQGHIPGAVHLERSFLEAKDSVIDGIIAPPGQMQEILGELGIINATRLVVYDDDFGCFAAHLWWILKVYGNKQVRVLNGGFDAWRSMGYEVERGKGNRQAAGRGKPPCKYIIKGIDYGLIIGTDQVKQEVGKENVIIIDTRSKQEFYSKQGRIPGSININYLRNFNKVTYKLKSEDELRALYSVNGVTPEKEIICYCNTGVRSAHTVWVLKLLDYPRIRNYNGSWAAWTDAGLPLERGNKS